MTRPLTSRTLRAVWARRHSLAMLLLTCTAVVGAGVVTVEFARASDTPLGLALPLVLLGLVAVPGLGRDLAVARRGEFALARLRGQVDVRLLRLALGETAVVLVVGVLAGLVCGQVLAVLLDRRWLGSQEIGWLPDTAALLLAFGVLVVGLVAVRVGMHRTLREPLVRQLTTTERPRGVGVLGLFGIVLVLMGAVVAIYRTGTTGGAGTDWVVSAGPALVGLGAGQLVLWVVLVLGRLAVVRTRESGLAGYLAARRVARAPDRMTALRLLVAALTLAVVALSGARAAADYADETARLRQAGPLSFAMPVPAVTALTRTRTIDPEGRWLMAAAVVPVEEASTRRRAFVDAARYDRVVGDFLDGTGAAGLTSRVGRALAPRSEPVLAAGATASVRVSSRDPAADGVIATVRLRYRDSENVERVAVLATALSTRPTEVSADLDCRDGCGLVAVSIAQDGDRTLPITLGTVDFGGVPVTDLGSDVDNEFPGFGTAIAGVGRPVPGGGEQVALSSPSLGSAEPTSAPLSGIITPGLDESAGLSSPGGVAHPLRAVSGSRVLPWVDGVGVLADLPSSQRDDTSTVPGAEVLVLARADTPDGVIADLRAAGAAPAVTLDDTRREVIAESGAARAWLFVVIALAGLVLALAALLATGVRQRALVGREVAALRLLLVSAADRRGAVRRERWVHTTAAVTGTFVGGVVATHALLAGLPLLTPLPQSIPPVQDIDWPALTLLLVVSAPVVYWLTGRAADDRGRADPAGLRERDL